LLSLLLSMESISLVLELIYAEQCSVLILVMAVFQC